MIKTVGSVTLINGDGTDFKVPIVDYSELTIGDIIPVINHANVPNTSFQTTVFNQNGIDDYYKGGLYIRIKTSNEAVILGIIKQFYPLSEDKMQGEIFTTNITKDNKAQFKNAKQFTTGKNIFQQPTQYNNNDLFNGMWLYCAILCPYIKNDVLTFPCVGVTTYTPCEHNEKPAYMDVLGFANYKSGFIYYNGPINNSISYGNSKFDGLKIVRTDEEFSEWFSELGKNPEDLFIANVNISLKNTIHDEDKTPIEPIENDNPYDNDPDSQGNNDPGGHKGGNGKYQDIDEDVPIPELPGISATDTGLCTLYNPSNKELKQLSDYLWSDVFSVESFKKLFADPMDIILGMSIVPLKVSDGARAEIKVGGLSTGVSMNKCKTQYIEVDCGSLDISNYWDNFMDYDPYSHYTLYLPYVGYKVLHADELVDKTITVKYHCDILSGACMAYVQCGKKVLYCFEGNISIQIPVTSASYDNMIHGILQMASGVGQIIAGGASMAAGGAGAGLMVSGAVGTATGATSAIKPTIGRSGNAESSTGLMGIQKPYLIISRPRAVVPSGLNKYSGYPAYKGGKLGDFNNFTVVQDIRIKNLNGATMEEMNEAERLCKEGVIV